jgi:hypothetical protein
MGFAMQDPSSKALPKLCAEKPQKPGLGEMADCDTEGSTIEGSQAEAKGEDPKATRWADVEDSDGEESDADSFTHNAKPAACSQPGDSWTAVAKKPKRSKQPARAQAQEVRPARATKESAWAPASAPRQGGTSGSSAAWTSASASAWTSASASAWAEPHRRPSSGSGKHQVAASTAPAAAKERAPEPRGGRNGNRGRGLQGGRGDRGNVKTSMDSSRLGW